MNMHPLLLSALQLLPIQQAQADGATTASDSTVSLLASATRIWKDDRIAVYVTLAMILVQLAVFFLTLLRTLWPLAQSSKRLSRYGKQQDSENELEPELRGIKVAIQNARDGEPVDVDYLLEPSRLLPDAYNARLDSAAPGLFTALGILGTFVGLILAFLRVDPTRAAATNTISPLMGGMVVAFVNSLIGVFLSIVWSYRSRVARHRFDIECRHLAKALRDQGNLLTPEVLAVRGLTSIAQLIEGQSSHFQNIERALAEYAFETKDSSHRLLEELVPRLEDAFRSITAMPFEKLDKIVTSFEAAVEKASERQLNVGVRLSHVADELRSAEEVLVRTVDQAGVIADRFTSAVSSSKDSLDAASSIVAAARLTAGAITESSQELQAIVTALFSATKGLGDASAAIGDQAAALRTAVSALQQASAAMEAGLGDTVTRTVDLVRGDLNTSTETLVQGYRRATEELIDQIDERVTDLTDRLSAELTTLANRLPAEVQTLNEAADRVRRQITLAIAKLEEATVRFAENTPEKLKAILVQFDQALAEAVNHFAGTLATWDGHVATIADVAERLQQFVDLRSRGQPAPSAVINQES